MKLTINYLQSKETEEIELNMDDGSFAAVINTSRNEDVLLKVEGENVALKLSLFTKLEKYHQVSLL